MYLQHGTLETKSIGVNSPGLPTVTVDHGHRRFVGLPVDSWDQLPIVQRCQARNRISINLGQEARFWLFINLTLQQIAQWLKLSAGIRLSGSALGNAFMQRDPTYPVVKLKIAPYEAYLAPTENLIHDGCSLDKSTLDLHLTFLGHFGVTA